MVEDIIRHIVVAAPPALYVYYQAKALIYWDGIWRFMALILSAAQCGAGLALLHQDADHILLGLLFGSGSGLIALACLAAARQFLLAVR